MPPGCSARSACLTTCHGSGRSSTIRSSPDEVDPVVAVADLHPVAVTEIRPEERLDVLLGTRREVLAELVAGDVGAGAQQGHRQRTGADTGFEHACAGKDVGQHQDRAEVLRIDHLRATRHLEHEVRQRRPERREGRPLRRAHQGAFGVADDVGVGHESGMRVELAGLGQRSRDTAAPCGRSAGSARRRGTAC